MNYFLRGLLILMLVVFKPAMSLEQSLLRPFQTGYRNIFLEDSSRIYKSNTRAADRLHWRSLELDVWYPVDQHTQDSAIRYRYFMDLLEQRSNRFRDDTVFRDMTTGLVQYMSANLGIEDTAALTRVTTSQRISGRLEKIFRYGRGI